MEYQGGNQGTASQQSGEQGIGQRGQQMGSQQGGRQTGGGQYGQRQAGTHGQGGTQSGMTRQQGLSPTQQHALEAITEAIQVCAWCADQCIQEANPEMVRCIQLCEEVQELGEAAHVLLARDAQHSTDLLCVLQQAMTACANECARHAHGHCRDCATTLDRVIDATAQLVGGRAGGGQPAQQF